MELRKECTQALLYKDVYLPAWLFSQHSISIHVCSTYFSLQHSLNGIPLLKGAFFPYKKMFSKKICHRNLQEVTLEHAMYGALNPSHQPDKIDQIMCNTA